MFDEDFELESRMIQYQLIDEMNKEDFLTAFESDELFEKSNKVEKNIEELELIF